MNTLFIATSTAAGVILALLMNEVHHKLRARFYQSAMFFPSFISAVVISYFTLAFLSTDTGLINQLIMRLGGEPIPWYSSPEYWPAILTLINLWKTAGFGSILYLAGMLAINPEYYEAAKIDGASKLKQIRYITLPLITPILVITTLLAIGRIFYADFGLFYVVTRNTPQLYPTTDVIDTFVFRSLRQLGDLGMAAAAGFMQSVIGFVLVIASNLIVRRIDPDKALF
jgi:putative aldouronate transport system permease protein